MSLDPTVLQYYFQFLLHHPWYLLGVLFQIWMFVDAVRRQEYVWALFIFIFSVFTAMLYYFYVYRSSPSATMGFELPGAHDRRRIKELEAQIHHLDKAHHHLALGDIYFQQGKLDKAESCYRASLERDPCDIDARAHLGQCLLRQKKAQEAQPLLHQVCTENPKHDYGHSLMAYAESFSALGQPDTAMEIWKRVLENHSYARARVQLAELYLQKGERALAEAELKTALSDDAHAPAFQRKCERVWIRRAKKLLR